MSARVTRKRARATEEEEDLPPPKREQDPEDGLSVVLTGSSLGAQAERPPEAREGQDFSKDDEFWFDDGTVILVAGDVEFRVYKGLLAGLSSVFKDLFAENHPVRNVRIDGEQSFSCPVVRVSDSPEDLRHLLRACFSKRLGRSYDEERPSYHEVSATIRLGDKYKIAQLYARSMEYLKRCFPSTLSSWTALKNYAPSNWNKFEEIGVINLARATGELSLLPSAFLAIVCSWSPSSHRSVGTGVVHGFAREDGSAEYLSPEDVTVCFDGKTKLHNTMIAGIMRSFKPVPDLDCKTPNDCRGTLRAVLVGLEKSLGPLTTCDPFGKLETFVRTPGGLGVCAPCLTMVRRRNLKEHKDVWDRLPELLGINVPGWKPEPPPHASNAARRSPQR